MYFAAVSSLRRTVDGVKLLLEFTRVLFQSNFAEGTVRPGFVEYMTLQNAGAEPAAVTLSFQAADDAGAPVAVAPKVLSLPAASRSTVNVNDYIAGLGITAPVNLSVAVSADHPIAAERPMYFAADPALGRTVDGGPTWRRAPTGGPR